MARSVNIIFYQEELKVWNIEICGSVVSNTVVDIFIKLL